MKYTIATIGSHSALQILKGAKLEGFKTLVIVTPQQEDLYRRFNFIDKFIQINSYSHFENIEDQLIKEKTIIVPHGSFVAYLGIERTKHMKVPYFGNKKVLDWEANRQKQYQWLNEAGLLLPKQYKPEDKHIEFPVIVKSHGAAGGKGYFLAFNHHELKEKLVRFSKSDIVIQQYIVGVPLYIHYFYSPLTKKLEIMSMDRRYETNVDGIGRIPAHWQEEDLEPSFLVVGNSPLVLRESMLLEAFTMGEDVVATSKELIDPRGLVGAFCLETIITQDKKIYSIEISCRIVAGTNLFINGSPYSSLIYNEPMSTGRRIAREIKMALKSKKLSLVVDY